MPERTCESCGGGVASMGRGRPRRFCTDCRPRTYQPKPKARPKPKAARLPKPPRLVACVECSSEFTTKTNAKVCRSCADTRRRRQNREAGRRRAAEVKSGRTCDVCFGPIPYGNGRSKRCSPQCSAEARRHGDAGWPPNACALKVRSCIDCGAAMIVRLETGAGRQRCGACVIPEADRLRARRAARRSAVVAGEVVRLSDVAQRDGRRCQLCCRKVAMGLKHPDPWSPSLDHVIPLSEGGEHTMANVQLAHLRCNMVKGNRPAGEQLRLVG